MTNPAPSDLLGDVKVLTKAEIEKSRVLAQAEAERRKRDGEWGGKVKAHTAYQYRPVEWIVKYLEIPEETLRWSNNPGYEGHRWDGTVDPIIVMLEAVADWRDVAVESATGTGKTFTAACITLWFLACFPNSLVAQWAPKEEQLLGQVWMEIGTLFPRFKKHFPMAELYTGVLRMLPADDTGKERWAAKAYVAGVGADEEAATKAQGLHREHMLIITEETPGIHPSIMKALDNTRTDDHNLHLALGNPNHRKDELHRFADRDSVVHIRISAYDHPNIVTGQRVIPGALGRNRLRERIKSYPKGSRLYQSRIRGISPAESADALIRWDWCVAAARRQFDESGAMTEWAESEIRDGLAGRGVDVANSEAGDRAAIARGVGACLSEVEDFPCPDANVLGARVAIEIREHDIDPRYVGVDSVGVGAGTVNELKRLGIKVRDLSSGRRAIPGLDTDTLWSEVSETDDGRPKPVGPVVVEAERFNLLRSQMWWRMREDLRMGRVALPYDEELFEDLTTPTYSTNPRTGNIEVEPKEETVKRLGRSPNKGDAAVYWNWVRRRRPVNRTDPHERMESTRDVDRGLERLLHRHEKHQKAMERERRRALRMLKRSKNQRRRR